VAAGERALTDEVQVVQVERSASACFGRAPTGWQGQEEEANAAAHAGAHCTWQVDMSSRERGRSATAISCSTCAGVQNGGPWPSRGGVLPG
jgi:hypothetical protein